MVASVITSIQISAACFKLNSLHQIQQEEHAFWMRDTALADLSVRAGVPVWVVDYNPIGSSQIDSQTSNPCCQEEDEDIFVLEKDTQKKLV